MKTAAGARLSDRIRAEEDTRPGARQNNHSTSSRLYTIKRSMMSLCCWIKQDKTGSPRQKRHSTPRHVTSRDTAGQRAARGSPWFCRGWICSPGWCRRVKYAVRIWYTTESNKSREPIRMQEPESPLWYNMNIWIFMNMQIRVPHYLNKTWRS